jgi:hypothetical protein
VVDKLDLGLKVRSYSNSWILIGTAISAVATAIMIMVDSIYYRCCYEVKISSEDKLEQFEAEEGMRRQSEQIEEATQSTKPFEDAGSTMDAPVWASTV